MALLHVASSKRATEILGSLPYFCTKNETMIPLHVATLTELLRLYLASRFSAYLFTKNETMAPLHVATLTVQKGLHFNFSL